MTRRLSAPGNLAFLAIVCFASTGCGEPLDAHRESLVSLHSTTEAIADGWLAGDLSGTFTRSALEQTFQLVERERQALATPKTLTTPDGRRTAEIAGALSETIALLIRDVRLEDAASLRTHLRATHDTLEAFNVRDR